MSWAVRSETIKRSLADLRWQAQALCRLVPRHARIRGLKFPAVTGARIQVHIDRPHRRDSGCWRLPPHGGWRTQAKLTRGAVGGWRVMVQTVSHGVQAMHGSSRARRVPNDRTPLLGESIERSGPGGQRR